jgi:CBS domain-containing protein/MFS family permease
MGMISLIIGFAPAIGPSLSGVLVDAFGWRALFTLSATLSVVVIILAAISLKDYGNFKKTAFDPMSAILSTVGLVCLLYGLSTFASSSNLVITFAMILIGVALVAAYVVRQTKLEEPMLNVKILKTRNYACAVCVMILVQAAMMGTEVITPIYIQSVRGLSATMSGLAMMPGAIIGAFVGMIAGRLFDRFGVRKVALPGACVALLGGVALSLLGMDTQFMVIALSYTVLSVGLQFTMTPINTWGVNSLDNSVIQHAQGLSNTMNQIAGSLGTAILVSISALSTTVAPNASELEQLYLGEHMAFSATAIMICVAVLVIAILVKNKKPANSATSVASQNVEGVTSDTFANTGHNKLKEIYYVADIMKKNPAYVLDTMSMDDVIRLMASNDTSGLPVCDEAGMLRGFISDADVARYIGTNEISIFDRNFSTYKLVDDETLASKLEGLFALNVMHIATKHVISLEDTETMDTACKKLAEGHIKKMPVVSDGKLVGTLSRRDVVNSLALMLQEG